MATYRRRYLVRSDEPQSFFTGKQQRDGVSIMPFLVAGVWRPRGQLPVPGDVRPGASANAMGENLPVVGDGVSNAVPDLAARVEALHLDQASDDVAADTMPPSGPPGRGSGFDWAAYHAVWKDVPIDQAITAMFAEFSVLHAELSGYTCSTTAQPLTLDVGKCIAERAQCFVTYYVTPILGPQQSTKVHKLFCHVLDAIRMHGNICNGNSGINEQLHKADKPYYARTNKDRTDFTRQIVVQAQGARILQRRILDAQEAEAAALDQGIGEGDSGGETEDTDDNGGLGGTEFDVGGAPASGAEQVGAAATNTVAAARTGGTRTQTPGYHLRRVQLSSLARGPGLSGVAAALGLPDDAHVRVATSVKIEAVFDCGTPTMQLLYASPSFRGEPWYDHVLFSPIDNPTSVSVGEVRAIVRDAVGDMAVLAQMDVVPAEPGCPMVARGCTRLGWSVRSGEEDVTLIAVPVSAIRRVLHVVPDFADLVSREGLDAEPAGLTDLVHRRLAMRYFINAFSPWGP